MTSKLLLLAMVSVGLGACALEGDGGDSCEREGQSIASGETWSPDGCNTCRCEDGDAVCTLVECVSTLPPCDADESTCKACAMVAACYGDPQEAAACIESAVDSVWIDTVNQTRCLSLRILWIDEEGCGSILEAYESFEPDDMCED
jgi:hypothetical protein